LKNIKKGICILVLFSVCAAICSHWVFGQTKVQDTDLECDAILSCGLSYAGGSGTEDDPYLISTPQQLADIKYLENAYYRLNNDIVLPKNWEPIKCTFITGFIGTFDGAGHTITVSDFADATDYEGVGIFCSVGGTIKNLNVHVIPTDKLYKRTTDSLGVICAHNSGCITNCSVSGELVVNMEESVSEYALWCSAIGGIAAGIGGGMDGGTIENCSSTVNIITNTDGAAVGGIVGYNCGFLGGGAGYVSDCYYKGNIIARNALYAGGIAGKSGYEDNVITDDYAPWENSRITNSYVSAIIDAQVEGAIIGNDEGGSIVTDCYFDKDEFGETDIGFGDGKTPDELKNRSTYKNWDFDSVWGIDPDINDGFPYLRSEFNEYERPKLEIEISDMNFEISNTKALGNVKVKINNLSDIKKASKIIVAIYDDKGILIDNEIYDVYIQSGENHFSLDNIEVDINDEAGEYTGKIFIWESMYSISPLSDAPIFEIQ